MPKALETIVAAVCLINGIAMLLNKNEAQAVFRKLGEDRALSYFIGSVMMSLGIAVAVFSFRPTTIPGWLTFAFGCVVAAEGTSFLIVRDAFLRKYMGTMDSDTTFFAIAIGYLCLGVAIIAI